MLSFELYIDDTPSYGAHVMCRAHSRSRSFGSCSGGRTALGPFRWECIPKSKPATAKSNDVLVADAGRALAAK